MKQLKTKITQKATEHMDGNLWVRLSDVLSLIDQEEEHQRKESLRIHKESEGIKEDGGNI